MKQISLFLILFVFCQQLCSQTITLKGLAFFDNNRNMVYDAGDSVCKQGYIDLTGLYFHSVITDSNGLYEIQLIPGYYIISLRQFYNLNIYGAISSFTKILDPSETDTVVLLDFAIPKRPLVETFSFRFYNNQGSPKSTGGNYTYTLSGAYQGTADSMLAKFVVEFDTLASFVGASVLPNSQSKGKVEWNQQNVKKLVDITVTLQFPAVGDTLDQYRHKASLVLYNDSASKSAGIQLNENIQFVVQPIGKTKGLKWLRNFTPAATSYNYSGITMIDTAEGGLDYFMAGGGYNANGKLQPLLAKLSNDGLTRWMLHLNDYTDDHTNYHVKNVIHTKDGGCIVGGYVMSGWDTVKGYKEQTDLLIFKFNADGQLSWKKYLVGSRADGKMNGMLGMVQTFDGGFVLAGETYSHDGDFFNANADTVHSNLYIMKLSADGHKAWCRVYGGSYNEACIRLKLLQDKKLMLLATSSSKNGDVKGAHNHKFLGRAQTWYGYDSAFTPEAWVLYLDENGEMIWNRCFGGTNASFLTGVIENDVGFLLAGYTNSKNGDLSNYSGRYLPLWLVQANNSGQILWQKQIEEHAAYREKYFEEFSEYDQSMYSGLYQQKDGTIMIAGTIADKYGRLKSKHGKKDIFISNLSMQGDLLWQQAVGGTDDDYVHDICVDGKGDILIAGCSLSKDDDMYGHHNDFAVMVAKIGRSNTITGKVFIDLNRNNIYDDNEPLLNAGEMVSISESDTLFSAIKEGLFHMDLNDISYSTKYVNTSEYFTPYPDSIISHFSVPGEEASISFGLKPKAGIKDLQVAVVPQTVARPGYSMRYKVITKNVGTVDIDNVVVKLIVTPKENFLIASRDTISFINDTLSFQPINLPVGALDELFVTSTLANPPILKIGDTVSLTAMVDPAIADTTPFNNITTTKTIARDNPGSNEKSEIHAGVYTADMKAKKEPFQYQVRFQNTGVDTAYNVTIKDSLDPRLNSRSLKTISSSHPYKMSVDKNMITWQFDFVKLPAISANLGGSQGYVSFTVEPTDELKAGDTLVNRAAVYFDINLPVITNEAFLTLVVPGCPLGNVWTGEINSNWENPYNWSCGSVPDEHTDVFIKAGTTFQPQVNAATATCKSIQVQPGAQVWIKTGSVLNVTGNRAR